MADAERVFSNNLSKEKNINPANRRGVADKAWRLHARPERVIGPAVRKVAPVAVGVRTHGDARLHGQTQIPTVPAAGATPPT
jgi:hypothetical protein